MIIILILAFHGQSSLPSAGPHLNRTGELHPKAFALESLAGAYWRGDETQPQLQRIYGTAWETPEQLKAYLTQKEEAKRRDHRKLGQTLNLFSIQEAAGGGLVFWHPSCHPRCQPV